MERRTMGPPAVQNEWPKRLSALLGTSLIVPIVGEFAIALINSEQFNLARALVFVGILGGCALALLFTKIRTLSLRLAMAVFLIAAGVSTVAFGFLLTVQPKVIDSDTVSDIIGVITLSVGLFILCAGLLLLYDQRTTNTIAQDLATPEPEQTSTEPDHIVLRRYPPYRADAYDGIVDLCRQQLSVKDLHYVAYYVKKQPVFRVDVLHDPGLARFYGIAGAEDRRAAYERHGRTVDRMMAKLNAEFRSMDSGVLIRLVLDVERGALYYYLIHQESERFAVGVTLDQDRVHATDRKMQVLVDEIRHHLGHPRITELER
ncbi:MAG TPA: hypothetical protein VES42_08410 [Pilimelia sp.]|nr:hypothetical protein [Pilimelia sp.]